MQTMNSKINKLFIGMLFIAVSLPFQGKSQTSKDEKQGDQNVLYQRFDKAAEEYNSALSKASDAGSKNRVGLKLATMYYDIRKYSEAVNSYDGVSSKNAFSSKQATNYVSALVRTNQAKRAADVVNEFVSMPSFSKDVQLLNLQRGIKYLDEHAQGVSLSKAPFSREGSSFWCADYDNGILFLNTGTTEKEMLRGARFFYYNGSQISSFDKVKETMQAGPATFSADKAIMLYTDNRYGDKIPSRLKSDKVVNNNLMIVELMYNSKKQTWDNPTELFKNKSDFSFCHPALSNDGNVLYFASNMSSSNGMDLYMSRKSGNGWSDPVTLGSVVNTRGDEVFPYVYQDYLLFSSNGQEGFGGHDIYAVQLSANGLPVAGTLQHLPAPINSVYNDYAFMNTDEDKGYLSSDRPDGSNMDAIYSWGQDLNQTAENKPIWEKKATPEPEFAPAPAPAPTPVPVAVTQPTPQPVATPPVQTYGPETTAQASPYTSSYSSTQEPTRPSSQRTPTGTNGEEIADGLANGTYKPDVTVYFGFNRSELSLEGKAALNDFYNRYLKGEYGSKVIVVAYTDVIGANNYNVILSKRRANSVKQFLMNKGMNASAIETYGRGELTLTKDQELDAKTLRERLAPARKADVMIMIAE